MNHDTLASFDRLAFYQRGDAGGSQEVGFDTAQAAVVFCDGAAFLCGFRVVVQR